MIKSENTVRALIFSDSHDVGIFMNKIYNLHSQSCNAVIHLGDGMREFLALTKGVIKPEIIYTNGNCDSSLKYNFPPKAITLGDYKVYLCHGAVQGVKYDLDTLVRTALENDVDIALFGHTHTAHDEYIPSEKLERDRPLYLINPGSITAPRDGQPSYALLELSKAGVYVSIGRV